MLKNLSQLIQTWILALNGGRISAISSRGWLKEVEERSMDEMFAKKVRAAAVAGWWTLLIFWCVLLIQWLAYVVIMTRQPSGILCLFGEGVTWPEIRTIWLWTMVAFKLSVGMMLFIVVWLTLWARQLVKK
jgi:hypothetical protein